MLFRMVIGVLVLGAAGARAQSTNVPDFVPGSWTLVVLPDTQAFSWLYPDLFRGQTSWIVTNKDRYNIKYVLHEGDIVDHNLPNEWANGQSAMSILDGVVPYAMAVGNHDYGEGPDGPFINRGTYLTNYFPATNFMTWPTFGGLMDSNTLCNSYHLFSAGGVDWLILSLEYSPRDSTLAWANQVASNYPSRRIILLTHDYLNYGDTRDLCGENIWRKLVNIQTNFTMETNGHVVDGDAVGYLKSTNQFGDVVHQMLVNYQGQAGNYLRILEFLPDGKTVQVKAYSPSTGTYKTDSQNQFQFILDPPLSSLPTVSNDGGASNVAQVSATLNGNLVSTGNLATAVSVYWGTADIGTNTVGWDHVDNFGQRAAGILSTNLTSLMQGATYYYRFYASNSLGVAWADPAAQFTTVSAPAIDNGSGAMSITPLSARLTGNLTAGGKANVIVYWGTTDGGTTPPNWQHTNNAGAVSEGTILSDINGLTPGTTYSYRCYATNIAGSAWAGSTASFQTTPTLANGSAYGMKIRFAGYNKAETLTNFPALVVLGTNISGFDYSQCQSPNGWDLRFTASNEVTELNYEIDQWMTNGSSYVWVQVPTISSSNDYIWAYWGNPGGTSAPAVYTTNGATWSESYMAVWHLNNTNALGNFGDSTAGQCEGTNITTTSVAGKIGNARNFDGTNAYINCGNRTNYNAITNRVTAEMWFKASNAGSSPEMCSRNPSAYGYFDIRLISASPQFTMAGGDVFTSGQTTTLGQWYYLTLTFDDNANAPRIYINGTGKYYDGAEAGHLPASGTLYLGKGYSGAYFPGALDEVRFSSVVRSSNWIWACYMNQASNSLFTNYQIQSGNTPPAGTTAHGIPYSWLQSHGIANTNNSVETENPDGDTLNNLQEYIVGTDPTNRNSCFSLGITNAAGQIIVHVPSVQATGGETRYYDVEYRTNLLTGSWQPAPNYTNIPGNGSVIVCTNTVQDQAKFYRAKVWLQ
jgi:hypothetical protein